MIAVIRGPSSRVMDLRNSLAQAGFTELPGCDQAFAHSTFSYESRDFEMTYRENGQNKTIYFNSESTVAHELAQVVSWFTKLTE